MFYFYAYLYVFRKAVAEAHSLPIQGSTKIRHGRIPTDAIPPTSTPTDEEEEKVILPNIGLKRKIAALGLSLVRNMLLLN